MKVLFICGSLEYGRDGVGDYTRHLALEILRKGHEAQIIAIHDKMILQPTEESQIAENIELKLMRIPRDLANRTKCKLAINSVQEFNPHVISLQFVHFAFHEKGLPFFLSNFMSRVVKNYNCHIMFHELWVGMEQNTSFKIKLWRSLQQVILHSLVRRMKPSIVHTQTILYKKQLQKSYQNAKLLPLFTNIKRQDSRQKVGKMRIDDNRMIFVVFGGIHPKAPIEEFAKELSNVALAKNESPLVKFIGHNGKLLSEWLSVLHKEGIETEVLGPKSEDEISEVLSSASFGISSTPVYVIEKSGTVAAMRQHCLKIVCVARDWKPKLEIKLSLPRGIYNYKPGCLKNIIADRITVDPGPTLSDVAGQFIADLQASLN